ncbi:MAG: hypothetical protein E2O66_04530 [Deltaproteobacteria bacterium]|nr:MAG: hypothetical protein E2O66_04530 [Deltaproteobacteria bacterium]TDJ20478.1 MAG: hypothetical protein E2O69_03600 [Deltaproteobacteria bacterium]
MLSSKRVAGFALRFVFFYGVLMAPWPGLTETYGGFYRAIVQIAVVSSDPQRSVVVRRYRPNRPLTATVMDTEILHRIPGTPGISRVGATQSIRSSRSTGYMPTALALALMLASPMSWKRRVSGLGVAALMMTMFVAAMPAFQIYEAFEPERTHFLISQLPWLAGPWRAIVHGFAQFSLWMGPYYLVPTLVWLLLAFKPEDWRLLVERRAAGVRV